MSLYLGNNLISGVAYPVEPSRNIGQIIQSTIPLSDAGLHLLDGSLINGSGIYSGFVDYIASIYDASANYFCSEADWQTAVTTYGVCGKFVYDSVNNTVRLPKVTGFIEGASGVANLGDLTEAGLPNITGKTKITDDSGSLFLVDGAFYNENISTTTGNNIATTPDTSSKALGFNASLSNPIYGNSSTVQPQTIKVLYYIVIATTTKTAIEVDIDEVATDLNGKCDTDGTNATFPHITETYVNGTSWYNVYSNGWCEQGGQITSGTSNISVAFLKPFINTNYNISYAQGGTDGDYDTGVDTIRTEYFTQNGFIVNRYISGSVSFWQASGYIS